MAPSGSGLQCEPVFDIIADRIKSVSFLNHLYIYYINSHMYMHLHVHVPTCACTVQNI